MNKKAYMLMPLIMALLLFPTVSFALEWEHSCLNSSTLFRETVIVVDGDETIVNQTVVCDYGCSDSLKECRPNNMVLNTYMVLVLAMFIAIIVAGYKLHIEVGLPLLMSGIFFSALFIQMDLFTSLFRIVLSAFLLLNILIIYVVVQDYRKGDE